MSPCPHQKSILQLFDRHRALQFYKQNEGRVNTPQDEFKIDDYQIFNSAREFVEIQFNSADTNSNDLKTAYLFQELIKAHQNDQVKSPLLHIELSRLRHYYAVSQKVEKEKLYEDVLKILKLRSDI